YADQRGDKQIDHLGDNLVQPLFQSAHEPDRDDDGDDVALVSNQFDVIQAEPDRGCGDVFCRSHIPGVDQIGVDHDHADDRAQVDVAAEYLGGAGADEDGQKYERCVAEQVDDGV